MTTYKKMSSKTLSPRQVASLSAIVDGMLPPIVMNTNIYPAEGKDDVQKYWEYRLSEDPHFMNVLQDTILYKLRTSQERQLLLLLLHLLSTWWGSLLLLGVSFLLQNGFVAFCDLPLVTDKTTALQQHLEQSMWSPKRRIFNSFRRLIFGLAFSYVIPNSTKEEFQPDELNETVTATIDSAQMMTNPFWKAMRYRGPPQHWLDNTDYNNSQEQRVEHAMKQLDALNNHLRKSPTSADDTTSTTTTTTTTTAGPTAAGNKSPYRELECDVVIVGSGCGGSVAAFELSKAGYDVIVVEQGQYIPPSNLSNLECKAMDQMYDSHALLTTEDGNVMILAGATVGGGSSINWSCCLPLPLHVQQEWEQKHKLKQFKKGGEFDASMKHTMHLMTDKGRPVEHNAMNLILQKGCSAMGYQWDETGQNLENTQDPAAGYIGFGDRFGNKRSAMVTFLNPAVGQYKARIMEQCYVENVLLERVVVDSTDKNASDTRRPFRAVGVNCRMRSASDDEEDVRVQIRSRKGVIVAAGALHSPCLLLRSGLRNRHIGRNLRLHPVTVVQGRFEHSIDFYLGAPMTTVCNEYEMGPSHNGYGCKIECPSAHPGLVAAATPVTTTEQVKERLLNISHSAPLIIIQRDSGPGGRVRCHPENGRPMIDYTVCASDQQSMLEGVKGMVQILAAAGAKEIGTCHYKDHGWNAPSDATNKEGSPSLDAYLDSISQRGMRLHDFGVFSAHQMGTCRMGENPSQGVIDPNGETWECHDLYVMDASTFPTASGANPMMTVLSMSHMLSNRLVAKLDGADKRPPLTNATELHWKNE